MKYSHFRAIVKRHPYFRSTTLPQLLGSGRVTLRQLNDWVKKGYVIQLKRGMYTLCDDDRSVGLSRYVLANELYSPSYVSLESALSYYGIIPEAVQSITSMTSKKTQSFQNEYGQFYYHHIKPNAYGDYMIIKDEFQYSCKIATLERAIIDYLYIKTAGMRYLEQDVFELSFRWQNLEKVNKRKLREIAKKMEQKKLMRSIEMLIDYIEEEQKND